MVGHLGGVCPLISLMIWTLHLTQVDTKSLDGTLDWVSMTFNRWMNQLLNKIFLVRTRVHTKRSNEEMFFGAEKADIPSLNQYSNPERLKAGRINIQVT